MKKKSEVIKYLISSFILVSIILLIQGSLVTNVSAATNDCKQYSLSQVADFNIFTFGDINQNGSDAQGRVASMGNINLSNYSVGLNLTSSGTKQDNLISGQALNFTNGTVHNGNVVYNTQYNAQNLDITNGTARSDNTVINFSKVKQDIFSLSNHFNSYTDNGKVSIEGSSLKLVGTNSVLNIFTLSNVNVNSSTYMDISVPQSSSVIVNIQGTNITLSNYDINLNSTNSGNILFNMNTATSLKLSAIAVKGTILAPNANVDFNNGVMYGTLIANNLYGNGQFNISTFNGCVDSTMAVGGEIIDTPDPTPVTIQTTTPCSCNQKPTGQILGVQSTSVTSTPVVSQAAIQGAVNSDSLANTGSNIVSNGIIAFVILLTISFINYTKIKNLLES